MKARSLLGTTLLTLGLAGSAAAAGSAGGLAPGGRTVAGPASLQMAATATERIFSDSNASSNVCVTVAVAGKGGSVTMNLTGSSTPSAVVPPGGSKALCVDSAQFVDLDCGASNCSVQWRVDRN